MGVKIRLDLYTAIFKNRLTDYLTCRLLIAIMKQTILGFGLLIFSLLVLFRIADYSRYRLNDHMEVWVAVFCIVFLVIGIILSRKMFQKEVIKEKEVIIEVPAPVEIDTEQIERIGISKREHEILILISEGLSNQQIADKLFISENTIKKHISNLFLKLDVERRTEAVSKAKALKVI